MMGRLNRDQEQFFYSFRRFRDSGIFRSVFERVVGACIGAGLLRSIMVLAAPTPRRE
jgi:hypothetical protein